MDWFDQDENIFPEEADLNLNNSFDKGFNIENVFLGKQNSFTDYEVRMDEFVFDNHKLDRHDQNEINSKFLLLEREAAQDQNKTGIYIVPKNSHVKTNATADKIFSISKDDKKCLSSNKCAKKVLSKEELASHPFLTSNISSVNNNLTKNVSNPTFNLNSFPTTLTDKETALQASHSHSNDNEKDNMKHKDLSNNCHSTKSVDDNTESVHINNSLKNYLFGENINKDEIAIKSNYDNEMLEEDDNNDINEELSLQSDNDCDSLVNNNSIGCNIDNNYKQGILNLNRNYNMNMNNYYSHNNNNNNPLNNAPLCNGNAFCPYSYYIPLQYLPISERMKIKKEKAKMLLEKKTKRENYNVGNVSTPKSNLYPNSCNNSENSYSNSQSTANQSFPHSLLKNGILGLNNNSYNNNSNNNINYNNELFSSNFNLEYPLNTTHLSKKELKMLRNRISAQRSRDRKKKEMDELKIISQNLLNENRNLKKELSNRDKEIASMREKLNLICKNCQVLVKADENRNSTQNNNGNNNQNNSSTITNENRNYSLVDISRRNFTSTLKYSLMTGFLVVMCLIAALSFTNNSNNPNNVHNMTNEGLKGRILSSVSTDSNDEVMSVTTVSSSSTGLIVYNPQSQNENSGPNKSIFNISKDIEKLIKKKINISDSAADSHTHVQALSFLDKKRLEFFLKMKNRKGGIKLEDGGDKGFLQNNNEAPLINPNDLCINPNGVALSIQEDIEMNEDENLNNFTGGNNNNNKNNDNSHTGIILKKNENYASNYNGIVPVNNKDMRYNYEHSVFRENIKSMYCKDFITTAEENAQMFKNLFDKLNVNIESDEFNLNKEDIEKTAKSEKNDDCMYLHMIVPSPALQEKDKFTEELTEHVHNNNNFTDGNNEKKVYYEVGCKIFEINKIYR